MVGTATEVGPVAGCVEVSVGVGVGVAVVVGVGAVDGHGDELLPGAGCL